MEKQAVWATDDQVLQTVLALDSDAFTIFDFIRTFAALYPDTWLELEVAFGTKGDGSHRAYTAAVYLGNRLWMVSKKPGSPVLPLMKWQKGGVETPNQRRSTPEERAMGSGPIIRVWRRRTAI